MLSALREYLPALACALVPLLCYLPISPFAEIGINDDWVYIKDALKVAQTWHISYSGAETPMLGWQLYLGALFIRIFGFSFTAVRFATVVEAMVSALLLERVGKQIGLNAWNRTLAILLFVLSPLYLPWAYTFMTDISGVLCIVLCVYMCLRALQAENENSAMIWICLAPLMNAAGGTVRQVAWLGALVVVPSVLWLLRKNRRIFLAGCIAWVASIAVIVGVVVWFAHQPYCIPQPIPHHLSIDLFKNLARAFLGVIGILLLYSIPLLVSFAGPLRLWKRWAVAVASLLAVYPLHLLKLDKWPVNAVFNLFTTANFEKLSTAAAEELHLASARYGLRVLLTGAALFGLVCLVLSLLRNHPGPTTSEPRLTEISWPQLALIFGPFSIAYIALLAPQPAIFDRYYLPLLAIGLLVLTRIYQERVRPKLPVMSIAGIVLFGATSVVAAHDKFAAYRGYASAIGELRAEGIPSTAILGPWEYNGWTEIEQRGHVNDSRLQTPKGAYVPQPQRVLPATCTFPFFGSLEGMPSVHPVYAVSTNPQDCGGQAAQQLGIYKTWLAPHNYAIYAVRLPASFPH